MSLVDDYKLQFAWRDWDTVLAALPDVQGHTVLDVGCGVGDLAAVLAARGARMIGVDLIPELLHEAQARGIPGAEFHLADLRAPLPVSRALDGVWCSFTAAYFTNLPQALRHWSERLRRGGWLAVVEVDDLFGHEPLDGRTKSLLEAYANDALAAGRYDFRMGRKLPGYLGQAGFSVTRTLTLQDAELACGGPARTEVLEAWRKRLERMKLLHDFCGNDYARVRDEFLHCLSHAEHRAKAKIHCCLAEKRDP